MKEVFCLVWITLEREALFFVQLSGTLHPVREYRILEDAILHSHLLTFHMNHVPPFKGEAHVKLYGVVKQGDNNFNFCCRANHRSK
jgi:hypothetical protein